LDGTAADLAKLFAEVFLDVEFAVAGFRDGDALVVAAVVGVEEERVVSVGLVLHQKLLVRPVHVELHLVFAAHFDASKPGKTLPVAHLHGQPLLGGVHNHRRDLGIHHLQDNSKKTTVVHAELRIRHRRRKYEIATQSAARMELYVYKTRRLPAESRMKFECYLNE
jgi:hypothetical protein